MSNVGLWDTWHGTLEAPHPYAQTGSYELGVKWLSPCGLVEDWGCGAGWLSTLVEPDRYRGIDGSHSPFADEIADLTEYRSETPGVFMRHVLEHNVEWQKVLDNALASFTERMFLVLFTPLGAVTHDLEFEDPPGVPNLSFRLEDLTERMEGFKYAVEPLCNPVPFGHRGHVGTETVFRLGR